MEVMGTEETKLANGGGAFPFWVSIAVVAGLFAVLIGVIYGVIQLFS